MWPFQPLLPGAAQLQSAVSNVGASAGSAAATATAAEVGASAGAGAATGVAASVGSSAGVGAATGNAASVGSAAGVGDASSTSAGNNVGASAGVASAVAVAASVAASAGIGAGSGIAASHGASVGSGAAAAVGVVDGVGSASGTSTATAVSVGGVAPAFTTPLAVQRGILRAAKIAMASSGVEGGVFDHVPQATAFPFVAMDKHQVLRNDGSEIHGFIHTFYLSVWSEYRGQKEVWTILDALWIGLHDQRLPLENGEHVLCQVTEQGSNLDADGLTYMGNLTARIHTNPFGSN